MTVAGVELPRELPRLGDRGMRGLLQVLVAAAEVEFGPAWREAVCSDADDES